MKNKKGLFALLGATAALSAVATLCIKKLKSQVAEDEVLIREQDLLDCETPHEPSCNCGCNDDIQAPEETVSHGCCGGGCCGSTQSFGSEFDADLAEEPTDNIADVDDLREFGVPEDIISDIEKNA